MHLIQIVLPLYDNAGRTYPRQLFTDTVEELTDTFGGATAFTRSPAEGFWEGPGGRVQRDDVIVIEVMSEEVDVAWWAAFRKRLEGRFQQQAVLIRAVRCQLL